VSAERAIGYGRNFRLYAVGQTVSIVGDRVALIALVFLVIHLSRSWAPALALFYVCRALPPLVAGLASGVIADHFNRQRLMVACDLGRAALLFVVPTLSAFRLWTLYPMVVALYALTTLFNTAARSALPDVVPEEKMMGANAVLSNIGAAADIAYAVGGGLVFLLSLRTPFYIDAASFVFSALMISAMRLPEIELKPMPRFGDLPSRLRVGLDFLLRNRYLRWSTLSTVVAPLGGGAAFVLSPLYASRVLGASPGLFGPLHSGAFRFSTLEVGLGAGALLGGVAASRLADRWPRGTIFAVGLAASGIADAMLGLTDNVYIAFILMTVSGACFGVFAIAATTMMQVLTPTEIRGTVFATWTTAVSTALAVGSALGGLVLVLVSYQLLWFVEGGVIAAASLFVWLRPDVRRQR